MSDAPSSKINLADIEFPEQRKFLSKVFHDISTFVTLSPTWRALAWADINSKYRRTMLGPWWLTVTQGCMAVMMALISGRFLGAEMAAYLPHFMISITMWNFISSSITESSQTLISAGGMIKATSMPISAHIMRMVHRNLIILVHNFAVVPLVWLVYHWQIGVNALLMIPGLVLIYIFSSAAATLISVICVRYRDVPPLIQAVMQLLFFISPIIWMPGATRGGHLILELNPMNYMLAVVRDPLLNHPFDIWTWVGAVIVTVTTVILAALVYSRYRSRVVYWV